MVSLHDRELEDTTRLPNARFGTVRWYGTSKGLLEAILADSLRQTENYEAAYKKFGLVMTAFLRRFECWT